LGGFIVRPKRKDPSIYSRKAALKELRLGGGKVRKGSFTPRMSASMGKKGRSSRKGKIDGLPQKGGDGKNSTDGGEFEVRKRAGFLR